MILNLKGLDPREETEDLSYIDMLKQGFGLYHLLHNGMIFFIKRHLVSLLKKV